MTTKTSEDLVLVEHRGRSRSMMVRVMTAPIRLYQLAVSPALAPSCRYLPSCSEYAIEAIEVHGAGRGSWLALRRLLRCHPFHRGGHDPVPPRVARTSDRSTAASSPTRSAPGPRSN